eukprot:1925932-Alexandrium_andersonii.AAC.1
MGASKWLAAFPARSWLIEHMATPTVAGQNIGSDRRAPSAARTHEQPRRPPKTTMHHSKRYIRG